MAITSDYKSHRAAYKRQRQHAKQRCIAWLFNYSTWWKIWIESREWENRGNKKGQYCMSRPGDKGPYSPWNVKIITHSENSREGNIGYKRGLGNKSWTGKKRTEETKRKISKSLQGHGAGRTLSVETRDKISAARRGKLLTLEHRAKISAGLKAHYHG